MAETNGKPKCFTQQIGDKDENQDKNKAEDESHLPVEILGKVQQYLTSQPLWHLLGHTKHAIKTSHLNNENNQQECTRTRTYNILQNNTSHTKRNGDLTSTFISKYSEI